MGSELYLKKGKECLFFGRAYHTLEGGGVNAEIDETEKDISEYESLIKNMISFCCNNLEELHKIIDEVNGNMEELSRLTKKLERLYIIRNAIDDGWEVEVDA